MFAPIVVRFQSIARSPRALGATAVVIIILAAAVVAVVALTRSATSSDVPAPAPAFTTPAPTNGISAFDVQSRAGDRISVQQAQGPGTPAGPPKAFAVDTVTQVEILRPAAVADIHLGDWVNVVGVPNQVKNFAIRWIIILPAAAHAGTDGIVRSPIGFAGNEADPSLGDRPILGGAVTAVSSGQVTVKGPQGPIDIDVLPNAPLRPGILQLMPGTLSDISSGDRIAGNFTNGPAKAVLVFPATSR